MRAYAMSRVRVLVERGCSHEVSDDDSHWCRPTTEPLTEFPPESQEAATGQVGRWMPALNDHARQEAAREILAAALEAITKEDE